MPGTGGRQGVCWRVGIALLVQTALLAAAVAEPLPHLRVSGSRLVDDQDRPIVLKGCNLGNWLLLEPWMLGVSNQFADQHEIIKAFEDRFGQNRAEALLDTYRRNWITPRELELVRHFQFNVVRVPFHHRLLADESTPVELRDDAFEWLDRAVDMAEAAGVYVILDMHGAPGGQSVDMTTGRKGRNRLWNDAGCQRRTAWLWQRIAERYRDRDAVIAYDLLNEPWHDYRTDVRGPLLKLVSKLYDSIREVDPETLIFAPGTLQGIRFYGDPRAHGWTNVGLTEHHYPGLFGQGAPTLAAHANYLTTLTPARAAYLNTLNVPFLVGEFNVVFDTAAQPEMMRRYYDEFAGYNWLATMWSLRIVRPEGGVGENNWYLATNAEPFALPDFKTASFDEIEAAFERLGTQELAVDEPLRLALTQATPPDLPIALGDTANRKILDSAPKGWRAVDVGGAAPGGGHYDEEDRAILFGRGGDLWGAHDEFRFLAHAATDDAKLVTWLTELQAPHRHAKAGLMLRAGLDADDAHVLIHGFADGRVVLAWRPEKGAATQERVLAITGFPMGLDIERNDGHIRVRFADVDGQWCETSAPEIPALRSGGQIGMVVCGHDEHAYARATFVGRGRVAHDRPDGKHENLLRNASFERCAAETTDLPADWQRWGAWFNREDSWTPRRDGECVLAYHHWRLERADSAGIYQEVVGIAPGVSTTFSVFANRDEPREDMHGPASVELRIESTLNGRMVHVASQTYAAAQIATGDKWSKLTVDGAVPSDSARVLLIVSASKETPRDAALKFDAAALRTVENAPGLVRAGSD